MCGHSPALAVFHNLQDGGRVQNQRVEVGFNSVQVIIIVTFGLSVSHALVLLYYLGYDMSSGRKEERKYQPPANDTDPLCN